MKTHFVCGGVEGAEARATGARAEIEAAVARAFLEIRNGGTDGLADAIDERSLWCWKRVEVAHAAVLQLDLLLLRGEGFLRGGHECSDQTTWVARLRSQS